MLQTAITPSVLTKIIVLNTLSWKNKKVCYVDKLQQTGYPVMTDETA